MPSQIIVTGENCTWIDVEQPTAEDIEFIHNTFGVNRLLLEDTTDPNHLPKFEQVDGIKFFLMRENTELERTSLNSISDISTKLSLFLLDKKIITIHRLKNRSIVETVAEVKLMKESEITPEKLALKLALKVMKSFDDEAQNLLEILDNLEKEIFMKNNTKDSQQIRRLYKLKRKGGLNTRILNISTDWIDKFRSLDLDDSEIVDLKDKQKNVMGDFDHLNLQVTNLISMFLALTDQKANQVMKVLAIYSMYFLPITFIAGLYGMNFRNMPELEQKYGYFVTLGVMLMIVICTYAYTRRKRW